MGQLSWYFQTSHDDVIKWKHFPRYWPFVRGIHRSLVNSPHKGQWRRAFMFLWSVPWINDSVNNREAGDLRRHHAHYDTIVISVQYHTDIAEYIIWWVLLSCSRERWDILMLLFYCQENSIRLSAVKLHSLDCCLWFELFICSFLYQGSYTATHNWGGWLDQLGAVVNSLAPGKFEWKFRHVIFKQILVIDDGEICCLNMYVTGLHWWSVNIGSGNGLVPDGTKPLPEPALTQISVAIWRH